jgi:flagellar basal body-associated protein FliL
LFDVLKITSTSVARGGWVVSALIVVQIVLLAATIGAFAFMLSSLWATLRITFVGVPESAPEEVEAEERTRRPLLALRVSGTRGSLPANIR